MTLFEKGLITVVCCDLLFAVVAVPLWMRWVPRNVVYGFRTRATLSDDAIWYEANSHFGRGFFLASLFSAAAAWALDSCRVLPPRQYLNATIALLAVPPVIAALLTARLVKRLVRERGTR